LETAWRTDETDGRARIEAARALQRAGQLPTPVTAVREGAHEVSTSVERGPAADVAAWVHATVGVER
jgi:hypothetical protein